MEDVKPEERKKIGLWARFLDALGIVRICGCAPAKSTPDRIPWNSFLPYNSSLEEHIKYLLLGRYGNSDSYIMANCVAHAVHRGYPDTKALRRKISSSIRATRCRLKKRPSYPGGNTTTSSSY